MSGFALYAILDVVFFNISVVKRKNMKFDNRDDQSNVDNYISIVNICTETLKYYILFVFILAFYIHTFRITFFLLLICRCIISVIYLMWNLLILNLLMLKYRCNKFFGLSERNSDRVERYYVITILAFNNKKLYHSWHIYKALI